MKTLILLISLVILDSQTKEKLTGVSIKTKEHTYYSDIYGIVTIPSSDTCKISFVSYKGVEILPKKDTVIFLDPR